MLDLINAGIPSTIRTIKIKLNNEGQLSAEIPFEIKSNNVICGDDGTLQTVLENLENELMAASPEEIQRLFPELFKN